MYLLTYAPKSKEPWNKGKILGQKSPLKLKEIWAIRIRLQLSRKIRDLALFNLAIDSKLRACDLVTLKVQDVSRNGLVSQRAIILQQKRNNLFSMKLLSNQEMPSLIGLGTQT